VRGIQRDLWVLLKKRIPTRSQSLRTENYAPFDNLNTRRMLADAVHTPNPKSEAHNLRWDFREEEEQMSTYLEFIHDGGAYSMILLVQYYAREFYGYDVSDAMTENIARKFHLLLFRQADAQIDDSKHCGRWSDSTLRNMTCIVGPNQGACTPSRPRSQCRGIPARPTGSIASKLTRKSPTSSTPARYRLVGQLHPLPVAAVLSGCQRKGARWVSLRRNVQLLRRSVEGTDTWKQSRRTIRNISKAPSFCTERNVGSYF